MERIKKVSNGRVCIRKDYTKSTAQELLDMLNIKVNCINTKEEIVASKDFVGTFLPKVRKLIIK